MTEGRWFSDQELRCPCCGRNEMSPEFVTIMDEVRELVDQPLIVNSAYRCPAHNAEVGGSPRSSHVEGLAMDVQCNDNRLRYSLLDALFFVTEKYALPGRIEIGRNYIHFDMDPEKPGEIVWFNDHNFWAVLSG